MNVLYIGPYRDNSIFGLTATNHIHSIINKGCDLTIRPLFLKSTNPNIDEHLLKFETNKFNSTDKYDAVIEYSPVEHLLPMHKISNKNYAIPIISYHDLSERQKSKKYAILERFDHILFDSEGEVSLVKKNLLSQNNIKLFDHISGFYGGNSIQYPQYNNKYKFYTFVNHESIDNIPKIVDAFLAIKNKINLCVLFIVIMDSDLNKKIQTQLESLENNNINKYIHNYIKILNLENHAINIHKSFDGLIEYKEYTNCGINSYHAKEFNKSVITNEPNKKTISKFDSFDTSFFTEKIKNSIGVSPIYNNTISSLGDILCK